MRRRWPYLAAALAVGAVVIANAQFSRDYAAEFLDHAKGRAFVQAYGALKNGYLHDVDEEVVLQGAIEGMLAALEDPFTYYKDPERAARDRADESGSFEGIGAVLTPRDRRSGAGAEILTVYRDGPAYSAGLLRGDVFLEVDGVDVRGWTPADVAGLVRGPRGTEVVLKMMRPGEDGASTFTVVRDVIEVVDVESAVLPEGVGYVSVRTFANQRLHEQLIEQLDHLEEEGITSLILDLRDNGGGFLNQGILVADAFLSRGDIVYQRARGVVQRLAEADSRAFDLPMVVLVNGHSASASEIVAGALQENHRALVVGEETFGKGVAQQVLGLSDGGQMVMLSFEWLTPTRRSINREGIAPDIYVEDTRYPDTVSVSGDGADPGQTVELLIDGVSVGTAVVGAEGTFELLVAGDPVEISDVQGRAVVDLVSDQALLAAHRVLLQQLAGTD